MNDGSWVIDASVLAKVYLKDEEHSALAADIVSRYIDGSLELIAPQVILYEIPRAIQAAVRVRRLDPEDGRQAIADFFALGVPVLGDPSSIQSMIQEAYDLAERVGCRLHDALYLVVAEQSGSPLLTAGSTLYQRVKDRLSYVRWMTDFPSAGGSRP